MQERYLALSSGRSASSDAHALDHLVDDERAWTLLLNRLGAGTFRYEWFGREIVKALGCDLTGETTAALPDDIKVPLVAAYEAAMQRGEPLYFESQTADDPWFPVLQRLVLPISHEHGTVQGLLVVVAIQSPFRAVFDNVADSMLLLDEDGNVRMVNPAAEKLFGLQESVQLQVPVEQLIEGARPLVPAPMTGTARRGGPIVHEMRALHRNGSAFPVEVSLSEVTFQQRRWLVAVVRDISARKAHEAEMRHVAFQDALTGLANRLAMRDRLSQAMARARREHGRVGLLLLDLDRFKALNDNFGHGFGDLVLRDIAERLAPLVRATDTLARIGGDEFVLIQTDLKQIEDTLPMAHRLLVKLREPLSIKDRMVELDGSIGIAVFPDHGDDEAALLEHADLALYEAKRAGGGDAVLFTGPHQYKNVDEPDTSRSS